MTGKSAWCSMPYGVTNHTSQHRVCDMRLKAGQIASCSCVDHRESPAVERESPQDRVESGAQSGPESAGTDRGLRPLPTKAE